ncbi:MAG: two-component sensor histidine kinase [Confluentimicrobium sp.]|jgi:two-component system osmolarity sensor histidine kinase EnvZ|uniref:ATP-binding protein n=1 Tax=Actibacterium sp. TaxID=1872125 RepID=UPI000C5855BF|nr:ATP-binding protein [Actibacterium sp.]MBC57443.1 two-component sensor histidine kinase [Actibacterium sp.]
MKDGWIKRALPRSLYGRAALILILPIVTIQLVVSVVFIQRHFDGVTRQMSRSVELEVAHVLAQVNAAPDADAAFARVSGLAMALQLQVALPGQGVAGERRAFYDLSGRTVVSALRTGLPALRGIDLKSDIREVRMLLTTRHGDMVVVVDRRRVSASNPHQLLVLMIATSLLMTLIAFIFLRNQLRPIKRLAKAADAFGKGRPVRYRPTGATEVRSAGSAFLDMRARIERQIEQRTMMLSGVSHDLRTPLTRLKLSLSLAEETPETAEMLRDVSDMERMLDAFLDFARSEALDDPEEVDPAELLYNVVDRFGPDVTLGPVPAGTMAMLRPLAVERALQNLVGNALNYGTRCTVGLEVTDRVLRFTVEDDGPGIPAEQRTAAMQAFNRLDEARNQNRGSGVGLGLAIASDIARSHGGVLRLGESAALGGLKAELVLAR